MLKFQKKLMLYLKNLLKKKLEKHRKLEIFYLIALIHLVKFIFSSNYRYNRCLVDPPSKFFINTRALQNIFLYLYYFLQSI